MTAIKPTAARDLRYGRRGGRWADNDAGQDLAAWMDRTRTHHRHLDRTEPRADGTKRWPDRHDAAARLRPTTTAEWEGAARMAKARRPEDRNALDREALERVPNPPSGLLA